MKTKQKRRHRLKTCNIGVDAFHISNIDTKTTNNKQQTDEERDGEGDTTKRRRIKFISSQMKEIVL